MMRSFRSLSISGASLGRKSEVKKSLKEEDEFVDSESEFDDDALEEKNPIEKENEVVGAEAKKRRRSGSFSRFFSRSSKQKSMMDDQSSVSSKVSKTSKTSSASRRSRSMSNPLRLFRRKSSSDNLSEGSDVKSSGRFSSFRNRFYSGSSSKGSVDGTGQGRNKFRPKKLAKKAMQHIGISGRKRTSRSPRDSSSEPQEESFDVPHEWFTQAEVEGIRMTRESTDSTYSALLTLLDSGASELNNPVLVARLCDLIEDEEDLFRALGLLRSVNEEERFMLLYHLHNLSGNEDGISPEDLSFILRHTPTIRRKIIPVDTREGENVLEKYESLIPQLRLEAFYLTHGPERLVKVTTIMNKYSGREEVLWHKLENQYDGERVPPENDVLPLLTVMPVIEVVVQEAFEFALENGRLSFPGFIEWMRSKGICNVQYPARKPSPWENLKPGLAQVDFPFSDFFRCAIVKEDEQKQKLSWRRRWCTFKVDKMDTTKRQLEIYTDDLAQSRLACVDLTGAEAIVKTIHRPNRKHCWTVFLRNVGIFLQVSRASESDLQKLLSILRKSSFGIKASQVGKEEEEEEEETDSASEGSSINEVDKFAKKLEAFFAVQNEDDESLDMKGIKEMAATNVHKQAKLIRNLEKKFPGAKVPTFEEASHIINP